MSISVANPTAAIALLQTASLAGRETTSRVISPRPVVSLSDPSDHPLVRLSRSFAAAGDVRNANRVLISWLLEGK